MVYFQISRVGFDCGLDKTGCKQYPDYCVECVKTQLEKFNLDTKQNIRISIIDSEKKREQMFQDNIWQKFLNVLNIKHILLIAKESGLPILDYPVSGAGVDIGLLTGFLQANISFSESGNVQDNSSNYGQSLQFYEFQYQNFSILLKSGEFLRVCLVLDQRASDALKVLVTDFLFEYEARYLDIISTHIRTGKLVFESTLEFVMETFNIKLVFPMVLTHTLLPEVLESIEKNYIQKAIIDFAKSLLASKQFFFVINLVDEVQKIVKIDSNRILYETHQLIDQKVIIPTTIESALGKISTFKESQAARIANNELISPILANDHALNELKEKAKYMDEWEIKSSINSFLKKAEAAEKGMAYKEALKECEMALYLASGFDMKAEVGRISFIILELDKKNKEIELEYALKNGEKAEKKKYYIKAINHYREGLLILRKDGILEDSESRIKKLEKKLVSLQKQL